MSTDPVTSTGPSSSVNVVEKPFSSPPSEESRSIIGGSLTGMTVTVVWGMLLSSSPSLTTKSMLRSPRVGFWEVCS